MATKSDKGGFLGDFRRFFLRGLAILLPTILTIAILVWAYNFVDRAIARHITHGVIVVFDATGLEPFLPDPLSDALKHGLFGFVVAILLVYFAGFFLTSFVGRAVWRIVESTLMRIPLVGTIYPNIKQVTDFALSERKFEFSAVVAVEYPRKGCWSLGLVTGPGFEAMRKATDDELVVIFVPSSPTPVTGYSIIVPRKDVIELSWSIDEVLRFTISAGVIRPERETIGPIGQVGALPENTGEPTEQSEDQ